MTVSIRRAAPADANALHALIEGAYRGDSARRGWTHEADLLGGQRTDLDALGAMLGEPAERMLVAERAGALVGCVAIRDLGDGTAYLGMLTVDPESQAGGLGRRLVAAAEEEARAFGAARVEMTVISRRAELVAWYERRGYRLTGERRPFPHGDERFGLPRDPTLEFVVLERAL
ncbi:MAG TPA: GNAT family N-acetyltransferase [Sphingomonas sp.]|jgi:ribosomal protein S18 acetylase RimI-like enzyme